MFIMITMFGLSLCLKLNNNVYQIQPGKRSYRTPTLVIILDNKNNSDWWITGVIALFFSMSIIDVYNYLESENRWKSDFRMLYFDSAEYASRMGLISAKDPNNRDKNR